MTLDVVKTHFRQQRSYEEAMLAERPANHVVLYIRRDTFPDGTYEEYAYIGPDDEVTALSKRCSEVDMEKVDTLLRQGKSFDEVLTTLGK